MNPLRRIALGVTTRLERGMRGYFYKKYSNVLTKEKLDFVDAVRKSFNMHYDAASQHRTRNDWGTTSGVPYDDIKGDFMYRF